MMNSEKEMQKIILEVSKLSNGRINFLEDLERLITITIENKNLSMLEELSFHAKFTSGLMRVVQKKENIVDDAYFLKAINEYQEEIIKVKNLLEKLLEGANGFIKSIFLEKYFQSTQQSLSNLNIFCSDLSFLKLYFNDIKTLSKT